MSPGTGIPVASSGYFKNNCFGVRKKCMTAYRKFSINPRVIRKWIQGSVGDVSRHLSLHRGNARHGTAPSTHLHGEALSERGPLYQPLPASRLLARSSPPAHA